MARERYLVGVSKEELEYTPPPPPPSTPKGKLENFWYHYKWATIGVVFAVVVLTVLVVQAVTRVKPDYLVCLVTQQEWSQTATDRLKAELTAVGKDRNGDGKVTVTIQALNVSPEVGSSRSMTNRQAVTAHIVARDIVFFVFDPAYYTESLAPAMKGGELFFAPLSSDAPGISEDGTYWNWKDSPLLKESAMQAQAIFPAVPSELYFGVRNLSGDDKVQQEQQDHIALLEAFIAAHA